MRRPGRLTSVVDVGALALEEPYPYLRLSKAGLCKVTAFEPQLDRFPDMSAFPEFVFRSEVIGDGRQTVLHVCEAPGLTSIFEPDAHVLSLFSDLTEMGRVIEKRAVQTVRLDDVAEVEHIDLLKVDAQGSELFVICGAERKLREAVVVQAEIPFLCLYAGQPQGWEIDRCLRTYGFLPHMLWGAHKRGSQVVSADVVYVRDFTAVERLTTEELAHMSLIVGDCYGSTDLAQACQDEITRREGP